MLGGDTQEAAEAANIYMSLPQGYETVLGENMLLISGGQLRIAHALVRPAKLILDECTSALDGGNQVVILESLRGMRTQHEER